MNVKTKLNKNHTVTYWSVYDQVWVRRAAQVPDRELAAMSAKEREKVARHLRHA